MNQQPIQCKIENLQTEVDNSGIKVEEEEKLPREEIKEQKKDKKKQRILPLTYERSLARRNIKINYFTGLCNFIKFKQNLRKLQLNLSTDSKCSRKLRHLIFQYRKLYIHLRENQIKFRTLQGWKEQMEDETIGEILRKCAREFFGKSFAVQYIANSKIQEKYKELYFKQGAKFFNAAADTKLFNVPYFKPSNSVQKMESDE
eukprot:TRINITY_DN2006_c0_g1_i1.p1 TRINITY_DN2006_c0_g1~~TRINITY_DN2006_c0_g1_i1.p1  ORF type:complete len:202 (+),score=37.58 TRINITY_DN2006_c0_g1_i1:377-982(+)